MHTRNYLKSKKGFSAKWYAVMLFIVVVLLILLILSVSRYFQDKDVRDKATANISPVAITETSDPS